MTSLDCSCLLPQVDDRAGIDASNEAARKQFGLQVVVDFINQMTSFVRQFNDKYSVYYNSGHIRPGIGNPWCMLHAFDLESLPAAQWILRTSP